jgi:putative methylase
LSITSAFLKARYILSIDIDLDAINILVKNVNRLELDHLIFPICADIKNFNISDFLFSQNIPITTIMNPPFGVQRKTADRKFLQTAFSFSYVVYSIHLANEGVQKFISRYISKFNWEVDYIFPYQLILERSYDFHKQKKKLIDVDIYRFKRKKVVKP